MIKFDHFSRFQKDFRQKMQGLHKIDHNSRKKLKTQGWKTQNSSKKLKVSAKSKTRFAENRSKKKGWFRDYILHEVKEHDQIVNFMLLGGCSTIWIQFAPISCGSLRVICTAKMVLNIFAKCIFAKGWI